MVDESTGEDCEHDKNFKQLITIAKFFICCSLVVGAFIYQQYRYSAETIEAEVFSKNITWIEACDEGHCVEAPRFNIITIDEHFTTSEKIYDQIEPKVTYFLGIKGWAFNGNRRKVVKVY